jgi:mRNA interferase MazF
VEVKQGDIVLCKFYFSDLKQSKDRPVLVFKDNLPHNDFIAIPISSKVHIQHSDEVLMDSKDFAEGNLPIHSKLMIRKTFVVSKDVVIKKYASLTQRAHRHYHQLFCNYFGCNYA